MADLVDGNLLVEGIAGQGKSIFLRYLCGVEMVRGDYIPIFLELRRVPHNGNLLETILATISEFGLKITGDQFGDLAGSGRILLLLDGFDEVDEADKTDVVNQIEHLIRANDRLRVIVSSRPRSGLESSPLFRLISLSDLEGNEYQTVIYRLLDESASSTAEALIKQVRSHGAGVKELLKTPLLVTLLVINYKSFQEVPAQLSDFYDSLFELLLQRHDGTKPGYRRRRLTSLNDVQYRRVFEALCYLLKKHAKVLLNAKLIYDATTEALKVAGVQCDAEHYVTDIVKITCLLVKDGEEYRFIHKSVQEYYAACFIKSRPNVVAEKIYARLFACLRGPYLWEQEIQFLAEIDSYRFRKFGIVPGIATYLGIATDELTSATAEQVKPAVLNRLRKAMIHFQEKDSLKAFGVGCESIPTLTSHCLFPLFEIDFSPVKNILALTSDSTISQGGQITVGTILDNGVLTGEMNNLALRIGKSLLEMANKVISMTRHEEEDPLASIQIE